MAGHIFISYSKKDMDFAVRLVDDLETAGFSVWIDREIGGGEEWQQSIEENLDTAQEVIVILSPNSVESSWVQHEGSIAYGLKKQIYPILIEDIPVESLPIWMKQIQFISFVTWEYQVALKQLIAALTPVDPLQEAIDFYQNLLNSQVAAHKQTGDLIGTASLREIESYKDRMEINAETQELLDKSRVEIARQRLLARGGVIMTIILVLVAIVAVFASVQASSQLSTIQGDLATFEVAQVLAETALAEIHIFSTEVVATANAEISLIATQSAQLSIELETAQRSLEEQRQQLDIAQGALIALYQDAGLILTGSGPGAMIEAENSLWLVNQDDNLIQSIDPTTGEINVFANVGNRPVDIVHSGDYLWTANQDDNTISRISINDGNDVTNFPVGAGPVALYWDGTNLWVANQFDGTVSKIDPDNGALLLTIEIDDPVAFAFDGTDLWVADFSGNRIVRLDINRGQFGEWIQVAAGPTDLLWDGDYLWVASRVADQVQQIDLAAGEVIQKIEVADGPDALAWDGVSVWVANRGNDSIQLIDTTTSQVLTTYLVGDFPTNILWDGSNLWVTNHQDNNLQRIDLALGAVIANIDVSGPPTDLLTEREVVWVGNQEDGLIQQISIAEHDVVGNLRIDDQKISNLAYDGNNLWFVTNQSQELGFVAVDDRPADASIQIIEQLTVDRQPHYTLWDGSNLWVASGLEDTLVRIDIHKNEINFEITIPTFITAQMIQIDESIWILLDQPISLQEIIQNTGELGRQIDLNDKNAADLIWDGSYLWVAFWKTSEVIAIDIESGEIVKTIVVDNDPRALLSIGETLWVANRLGGTVQLFDKASGQHIYTIPIGETPTNLIEVGDEVWVADDSENTIFIIDQHILELLQRAIQTE